MNWTNSEGGEPRVLRMINENDVAIISMLGDIDMQEVVAIRNTVSHYLNEGVNQLVLDLSCVQHINTTGVGILTDSLHRARHRHGDIRLANLNPCIQQVFELTGAARVFQIYEDRPSAVKSYRKICQAA